jgi:hypothetical protein
MTEFPVFPQAKHTILHIDVITFLRNLAFYSPERIILIEKHAHNLLAEYVAHKLSQGVSFEPGKDGILPLHTHGVFILDINHHQLTELGIINEVMEKLYANFDQTMCMNRVPISVVKPMPEYRQFAYAKLISGKYYDIQNYSETTHILINL